MNWKNLSWIIPATVGLTALYLKWIRPWQLSWGATDPVAGQLLMDGIGVLPRMRDSRIGTKPLHHLIGYANNVLYKKKGGLSG